MSTASLARGRHRSTVLSVVSRDRVPAAAATAAGCAYLATFALPIGFDVGLALLGLGALASVLGRRLPDSLSVGTVDRVFAAFVVAGALSLTLSEDPLRGLRLSAAFLPGLLLFMVLAHCARGPSGLRSIAAAAATIPLTIAALMAPALWASPALEPAALVRALGCPILVVPNDATVLALTAPFALGLVLVGERPLRFLGAAALVAAAGVLAVLQSRVGVLTMLAGVALTTALARPRRGASLLAALVGVVLVADGLQGFPLAAKFGRVLDPRIALWGTGLAMWLDAPVFGHGPHSFGLLYADYREVVRLPMWLPVDDRMVPWAHSLWVEALAERGLIGLVVLGALLGTGLHAAWTQHRRASGDARVMSAAVVAALLAFCGAATVELTFVRQWVVVFLCVLLGLSTGRKESS